MRFINYNGSNLNRNKVQENEVLSSEEKPSIVILLIDGVTSNGFQREMPLTKLFLDKKNTAFMKGFNRISKDSYQNILATLTGKVLEPEHNGLNASMPTLMQLSRSQLYGDIGWLFDVANDKGYVTHFNDDSDFLKELEGLNKKIQLSVDVNLRRFHQILKKISLFPICHNGKMTSMRTIDEMERFIRHYNTSSILSVNIVSAATQFYGVIPEIDEYLYNTLVTLQSSGALDKTILILSSTQEASFGPIPHTVTGNLENKFPLLAMSVPKSYKHSHLDKYINLKMNENRLTTYFDIYETVKDLLGYERSTVGMSLLREVSTIRECRHIFSTDEYCGCMREVAVDQVLSLNDRDIIINTNEHRILNQLYRLPCVDSVDYARPDRLYVYSYNMTDRINNFHTTVLPTRLDSVEVRLDMPITIFWKNVKSEQSTDFSIRSQINYNVDTNEARMVAKSMIFEAKNGCKQILLQDVCSCLM
ncbi:unnamed protein product [Bursaphelenchus okinawaensis]|uniref:Uncharacterized protein n=1 Tax=Bursaphelenchus okinawaensis TaxID=465554 RepID=A0A811LA89_9BILA|nr:unnamed protein product [Bursaphelenchus okinawaensis]CAG9119420.1 unnamed protein product [Bursaphelenchus okinawaensis]